MRITTAEQRSEGGDSAESNRQRLWFWRSGLATAGEHPWLGVGVGRLAGAARERVLATPDAPVHGADAHAHNLVVQIAAELGIPAGLAVLAGVVAWLALAWRSAPLAASTLAAIAMACVMLVHANLEHPFAYLYVLALFGAIAGQIPMPANRSIAAALGAKRPPQATRFAAFVLVAAGIVGYVTFMPVERATQVLKRQVAAGEAPHPDNELAARLNAVHDWSPYADFADTLGLMASVPTEKSAAMLAARCENAVRFAPTPYLLARCAADLQVAGHGERADNFARSLCRIYPEAEPVLARASHTSDRPQQIELLLDAERPEMDQRLQVGRAAEVADVRGRRRSSRRRGRRRSCGRAGCRRSSGGRKVAPSASVAASTISKAAQDPPHAPAHRSPRR